MGLFGGRKKAISKKGDEGGYQAPIIPPPVPVELANVPSDVTPTPPIIVDHGEIVELERVRGAESFYVSPQPSAITDGTDVSVKRTEASPGSTPQEILDDIESGRLAKSTEPPVINLPPSKYRGRKDGSHRHAPPLDEQTTTSTVGPSIMSGTVNTEDIRTLHTAVSEETKDTAFTITRNGQYLTLNGFANGHLMRWKFAAEEGPAFVRIPAVIFALGMIGTTLYPIVTKNEYWTAPVLISAFHICFLSFLIVILEARAIGIRGPNNSRARIRGIITRYMNLLKLLWGRGLLYIFASTMNLTVPDFYVQYTGIPMCVLGIVAICTGAHASYNLDQLKSSLTDESYLWVRFDCHDNDKDGQIDMNGFAELVWSLGLEFDDLYTYKAFQQIDRDDDQMITFDEFKHWWIVTQNDGKRLRA